METAKVTIQTIPSSSQEIFGLTIKSATIILVTFIIFFQDLRIIFNNALQSESTNYLLAIPLIVTYLIYRKRKMIRAVISFEKIGDTKRLRHIPTIAGILLSTTAILIYWGGSYTFTPLEYHLLALPLLVAGLTLILFNIQTIRQLAFPIAFLLFLITPPSNILYSFGSTLSILSSEASHSIIKALGIPSTLVNQIGKPIIIEITKATGTTMAFAVDIACSGIYSLLAFLIFIVLILYIIRDKPWKKLVLFSMGFQI
ncbi:MAG: exosortase/archaeosortase family protein [Dehalococcoidia bacterium]|nr:MAG: exosortase/archaeosortase family protein [Dehalococcoidia bacterium]